MRNKPFSLLQSKPSLVVLLLLLVLSAAIPLMVFFSLQQPQTQRYTARIKLLPGQQIWQKGVSSYIFGTNNTYNWSTNNLETNATALQLLQIAHIPLIRTWFFSPKNPVGNYGNLGTDAETDQRLQTNEAIGANCLGVLQDTNLHSFTYYQHLLQHVGNRCLIYEFGNEPGVAGAPGIQAYIQTWNQEIPTLRKLNSQAVFGGPVGSLDDIPTFLNAIKQSGVLPDFISFHDYNTNPAAYGMEIIQAKLMVRNILGKDVPVGITELNVDCCREFNPNVLTMTQYWTTAYEGLIQSHADFATEFDSLNHGGSDPLDMFDSKTQPRVVYTVLKNLIAKYSSGISHPPTSTPHPTFTPTPFSANPTHHQAFSPQSILFQVQIVENRRKSTKNARKYS